MLMNWDLFAYFVSGGNNRHPVYKRPKSNKKLNIELISAVYGVGNAKMQKDVRKIIQQHLDARDYEFNITNKVAGGDRTGREESALLKYKMDGKLMEKKVAENSAVPFLHTNPNSYSLLV